MTDSYVAVQPDSSGKKLQTYLNTVNGEAVHSEGMTLTSDEGSPLTVDEVDNVLVTIDFIHHEIHEGNSYTVNVYDGDVDIVAPKYMSFTAPDTATRCHIVFASSSDNGFLMQLYSEPTINAAGNAVASFNRNRNSVNAASLLVKEDCTTTNDGTLMIAEFSGGSTAVPSRGAGSTQTRDEWILKQGKTYLTKLTAIVDNSRVNISATWYEV